MKNFFTFEGCEGVGKSSQLRLLKTYCEEHNVNALFTREPGGSSVAESIRGIILDPQNKDMDAQCEAFLFAAARVQHLREVIVPALNEGKIVFCDRFVDSSYAYQAFGRGLGLDYVKKLNAIAVGEYMPEVTVFLDLQPQEAFKRKGGVDIRDRMEKNDAEFFDRVYHGYKQVITQESERFVVIDTSGTKFHTHDKIVKFFKDRGVIK
jgi:dTMP kinase